jgi:hypothetical protein
MKTPGFLEGVLVAAVLAICGDVIFCVLPWFFEPWETQVAAITLLSLAYLVYLLHRAPETIGRVILTAGWTSLSSVALAYGLPIGEYLLLQLGCIWLVRVVLFRTSLFGAVADLGLHVLAAAAAVWAYSRSGSVLLSLWSFFLIQALFPLWPGYRSRSKRAADQDLANPRFELAHRTALAALQRLTIR